MSIEPLLRPILQQDAELERENTDQSQDEVGEKGLCRYRQQLKETVLNMLRCQAEGEGESGESYRDFGGGEEGMTNTHIHNSTENP